MKLFALVLMMNLGNALQLASLIEFKVKLGSDDADKCVTDVYFFFQDVNDIFNDFPDFDKILPKITDAFNRGQEALQLCNNIDYRTIIEVLEHHAND